MMFEPDSWQEVADALRANPIRTALTMAGVFWGTFMLVAMLGFSAGLEGAAFRTMGDTATNAVFVWGQRTRLPYRGRQPGRSVDFVNADIGALRRLDGIRYLAPRNQLGGYRDGTPVVRGSETGAFQVMGDVAEFQYITTVVWDSGRFINPLDVAQQRKVAVIGREVHQTLWPQGGDPIGEWIQIRGSFFQVIGLFHSAQASEGGDREETTIHIPFSTFQHAFNYGDQVSWFAFLAEDGVSGIALEKDVRATLAERHGIHPEDEGAMGSFNAEEEFRRIQSLFTGIRGLTWIVGLATLLSGAVGVSNVLLIVVRERTREIGVRRALGATPASIVGMVLQESVVMTAVAGMSGLVLSIVLVELAGWAIGPDNPSFGMPRVTASAALLAATVLVVVGLVAGVLPARRAVAIEPVDALRAE